MRAHPKAARIASEDVAFKRRVMNLSGRTSLCRTVEEVGIVTQEAAHGEFVETSREVSVESTCFHVDGAYRINVSNGAYLLTSPWEMALVHPLEGHCICSQVVLAIR
jgi:hypothetical protein